MKINKNHRPVWQAWILGVLSLLTTCTSYQTRQLVPGSQLPLQEKNIIILHQGDTYFQLTGARFAENQLTGLSANAPRLGGAMRQFELHLQLRDEYRVAPVGGTELVIPLEMVSSAWVYDVNLKKTIINTSILTSVVTTLGVFGGLSMLALLTSCPCVYAYDGSQYGFAGEIYPGALQPALERHDFLLLESLRPIGDEYRLTLVNELQEVQHTNLVELLVCDHPTNATALMDEHGGVHTVREASPPLRAIDSNGRSVLAELSRRDGHTAAPRLMPMSGSGLYTLYATFPRLRDARSVKLVLRARNSLWLDYCFYRFQENFGSAFVRWQKKQRSAQADEMLSWKRDQGIGLSVYLNSGQRWKYVDCLNEVGPLGVREQVLVLELEECAAEELEIKLEAGFLFWEVDFLGVDYSQDLPVTLTAMALRKAENHASQDISSVLQLDDGNYCDQSNIGDTAVLRFPYPPEVSGLARTIFLHSKGYYELLREYSGPPALAVLNGFREPGAFPRYSVELFSEMRR